jgi:hypothetical protein
MVRAGAGPFAIRKLAGASGVEPVWEALEPDSQSLYPLRAPGVIDAGNQGGEDRNSGRSVALNHRLGVLDPARCDLDHRAR